MASRRLYGAQNDGKMPEIAYSLAMPFSNKRRGLIAGVSGLAVLPLWLPARAQSTAQAIAPENTAPAAVPFPMPLASTTVLVAAEAENSGVNLGVARAIDAMLDRAYSLIGTRYRAGGMSPETGFDCSGFAGFLYRDILGFQLPRSAHQIWTFGKSVERDDLRPGDLVFYNTMKRAYSHVGIYLGDNRFIHSPTSGGHVNIVNMDQRYWAARWNGAKRIVP